MSPAKNARWPDAPAVVSERLGSDHRPVVSGEIDPASAPVLERELLRVEHTDAETVTIDLSGVSFMDSAGLHLLSRADLRSNASGPWLRLAQPSSGVQRLLALVGEETDLPFDPPLAAERSPVRRRGLPEGGRSVVQLSGVAR